MHAKSSSVSSDSHVILNQVQRAISTHNEVSAHRANIISFLKFLHSTKEFEIYYLLFNSVEIKIFDNILEIFCSDAISKKLVEQIAKLLFTWKGEKCNIAVSKKPGVSSLKAMLISKIQSGCEWQLICDSFKDAAIVDLLLE